MGTLKLDEIQEDEFSIDPEVDMLINVDRGLAKIRELETEIKRYKDYLAEMKAFTDRKVLEYEARIDNIKPHLLSVLHSLDKKTIDVLNGTIKRRHQEKWNYPKDFDKLQFAKDNCHAIIQTVTTYKVSLNDIKKFIKSSGVMPDGVEVWEEQSFSYKLREGE